MYRARSGSSSHRAGRSCSMRLFNSCNSSIGHFSFYQSLSTWYHGIMKIAIHFLVEGVRRSMRRRSCSMAWRWLVERILGNAAIRRRWPNTRLSS